MTDKATGTFPIMPKSQGTINNWHVFAFWAVIAVIIIVSLLALVTRTNGNEAALGGLSLSGQLTYDGFPISEITDEMPTFWFRNEVSGQVYENAVATYNTDDGNYQILNLPHSKIGIKVSFHVSGLRHTFPGNYQSWTTLDPSALREEERANYTMHMKKTMHLMEPFDNSEAEFIHDVSGNSYPEYTSPLHFEWAPIDGAKAYQISVNATRNGSHPDGYGYIRKVIQKNVFDSSYELVIDPSPENTHYEFSVSAYSPEGIQLGMYMTTYLKGHGWDYRFKIIEPPFMD